MTLRVVTLVGTRPEIIKLSRVLSLLDEQLDHVLVHSGQNFDYELNQIFFEDLGLRKPDHFLEAAGATPAETIARTLTAFDAVLENVRPDAVLILGDTNSCLGVIAAKRRKIPIFHMEAGNRCFDQRVPEEINRKIVDHLSDVNLVYTEHARRYLLAEGLRADLVIKTGSPMREVLSHFAAQIEQSDVLSRFEFAPSGYFLVSAHREENVDSPDNLRQLLASLEAIAQRWQMPVLVSTHPRTKRRLDTIDTDALNPLIRFVPPLGFFDYVKLQSSAFCVVSDSGTLTEESALLGFPAIMIRQAHERPEGTDEGVLIMSGLAPGRVTQSIEIVTRPRIDSPRLSPVADYEATAVAEKVLRTIVGYTDYVNRVVWRTAGE